MDRSENDADSTPLTFSTTVVLTEGDRKPVNCGSRRSSVLTRTINVNAVAILFTVLVVSAVLCSLWHDTAVLRQELDDLSRRMKALESLVEYCNDQLNSVQVEDDVSWDLQVAELVNDDDSAASPFLSTAAASDSSSQQHLQRWKRNAAKEKSKEEPKGKKKPKAPPKPKHAFALNFEAEPPTACKMSDCFSLVGWKPSAWVVDSHRSHYIEVSGRVRMPEDGSYYIYAQITYFTVARMEAFAIMVEEVQLAICLTGVDYVDPKADFAHNAQTISCNTGIATHLRKGQHVWLKNMHMSKKVDVTSMKNAHFWGIVRLPG